MRTTKTPLTSKPYFFVSYSSREPHVSVLIPCLWIAFSKQFEMKLTPSALESGASQLAQITKLIRDCSFAVVVLDGLRPNVVFELGIIHREGVPAILLKEKNARVDIQSLISTAGGVAKDAELNIDRHLSDVKDLNYLQWISSDPAGTIRELYREYSKKRSKIRNSPDVEEPVLWQ